MASSSSFSVCFLLFLFFFVSFSNAIVFDLERDPSSLQYMMKINLGNPQTEKKLVIDLGGRLPWFSCHKGYNSSSRLPVSCSSPQCSLAKEPVSTTDLCNGTANNSCSVYINNPVTLSVGKGELVSDLVNATSLLDNDRDATPLEFAPLRRCVFGCATTSSISSGLEKTSNGVAGLGRLSPLSLVAQFAGAFQSSHIFALELYDDYMDAKDQWGVKGGKIYFGGGPYIHYSYSDEDLVDRVLNYIPLLINPKSKEEYYVDLRSIKVHSQTIPINKKLLSINKKTGAGGTKIDIRIPYTTLETSIYKPFMEAYNVWVQNFNDLNAPHTNETPNITMVTPVAPFTTCFNSSTLPPVTEFQNCDPPDVAFIFPKNIWNISLIDMVTINDTVACVGFVDGGSNPKTPIVIGAQQIGFVEFDISRSRLGFEEPNVGVEL